MMALCCGNLYMVVLCMGVQGSGEGGAWRGGNVHR